MSASRSRVAVRLAWLLLWVGAGLVVLVWWLNRIDEVPLPTVPIVFAPTTEQKARGAYLALAGNCAGCHTAPGGASYAGGRAITTPFGLLYPGNLTPDAAGLGGWSADEFWRALHNGRSRDGRLLYPAFPYPHFSRVVREDSDALFAFLSTLPPVARRTPPHALRFPFDQPAALAVWRALFFRPSVFRPDPAQSAQWNRGAYLVAGLGHCGACHSPRNALGATALDDALTGGTIPSQNWYAPSLRSRSEAGLAGWSQADAVRLLHDGVAPAANATVEGPMAEVVFRSLQHLDAADIGAIAVHLRALPEDKVADADASAVPSDTALARGAGLYRQNCAGCHGRQGEGEGGYPPLAGNRGVTMASPANVVQMILHGGFAPSTAGNPRPLGMPPFLQKLDDAEVAAVATYVRNAWGNRAAPVGSVEAWRLRGNAE
ncbi:c-type cytochrome [Xylophilus sp. Kf1]|nr:c-type cytochrome [Xylophilus sp. Kf1]